MVNNYFLRTVQFREKIGQGAFLWIFCGFYVSVFFVSVFFGSAFLRSVPSLHIFLSKTLRVYSIIIKSVHKQTKMLQSYDRAYPPPPKASLLNFKLSFTYLESGWWPWAAWALGPFWWRRGWASPRRGSTRGRWGGSASWTRKLSDSVCNAKCSLSKGNKVVSYEGGVGSGCKAKERRKVQRG